MKCANSIRLGDRRGCLPAKAWAFALGLAGVALQAQPGETNATLEPPAPSAAPTASTGRVRTDFNTFRLIAERNIFNAARSGRRVSAPPRENRRPARTDTLALVGVMSYEKGPFAFFDGSSTDYRKALPPGGTVAGLKVVEIQPNMVRLENGTNQFELRVGAHLRREDAGPWQLSESTEPLPATTSDGSSSSGATESSNDAADEVLRRLLQRREQETR